MRSMIQESLNDMRASTARLAEIEALRYKTGDNDPLKHDTGLIGTNTLRSAVTEMPPGENFRLSQYASQKEGNPSRYFKNPLGGLKQYYNGTFDSLGLMVSRGRAVAYTGTRGKSLAEVVDNVVDKKLLAEAVRGNIVTADRLDALNPFCPLKLFPRT